ncbi:MAG: FAD-binding protein [Alphaproteobacteria bacterium]|nr:FAD-binding protein [Alphaproteobacteria bacterium]
MRSNDVIPVADESASPLARRLRRETEAEILFDPFSRGRYSTDASIFQIMPVGAVVPRSADDIRTAIRIAREEGVPVLPRGAGTSQCGQAVGAALVIDTSKHLRDVVALDAARRRVRVRPGIVLDHLNAYLRPHGLFFPVDVSPANRATIGGMAGNNSCGSRSIRYGNMVHNVRSIDAILADGTEASFGDVPGNLAGLEAPARYIELVQSMRALGQDNVEEIDARIPKLLRKVGGYNIETIDAAGHNMANLLVGSEGTLAFFHEIELDLQPIPPHKTLGICHFPTFRGAMAATQHIVTLNPSAVELVDRTMIDLARDIAMFRPTVDRFVRGEPDSLLLVEFAGEDAEAQLRDLKRLVELMGDLGHPDAVVEVTDPEFQRQVWEVRKAGLNIMMSMKGEGKPVSFIEDCAVPLEHLADYTERLNGIFEKHGTSGTWYAHASVGTLHVRPVLNMKEGSDVRKMREIAEEAFAMVREYKGSFSGEHGDGMVRSEFLETMYGSKIARTFEALKDDFDPEGLFNPGKIVRPSKMDDRSLFRYPPGYTPLPVETALDWSEWGGFPAAIEMCNNNGTCRKASPGVMCPSYRATGDEIHVTRGRANALRLAITGQLGPDALTAPEMKAAMELCIACKGCKRECPTGVDMARMKYEFLQHWRKKNRLSLRDRLIAYMPRYAPWAARLAPLLNLRNRIGLLAWLGERLIGLSARRKLPEWRRDVFRHDQPAAGPADGCEVVLFVDTFNTWFDPENARAAQQVLAAAGYRVHIAHAPDARRPLCCGRTFLAAGLIDEARAEARRMIDALRPWVDRGVPVIGLEPSCLFSLRDEFLAMLPGEETAKLAGRAMLFEEFIAAEIEAGRFTLDFGPGRGGKVLLHGHCHQKAMGAVGAVQTALALVPGLEVETIESTCCGMAGAFGYEAEHFDVSMGIGELDVLPAVRKAEMDVMIVADGTSCRHQIAGGTGRQAVHVARVLADALYKH